MNYKDDEDFPDPFASEEQTRPGIPNYVREAVGRKQLMQTRKGGQKYQSFFDDSKWHNLDKEGRETFPKQAHKGGTITQQPALDHIIQYVAINKAYETKLYEERRKEASGYRRRNSLDLHDAFRSAVIDPDNLRLVSHDEHVQHGGSKRADQLSKKETFKAKKFFLEHLSSTRLSSKSQLAAFHRDPPKSSIPSPNRNFEKTTMNLRSQGKKD